MWELNKGLSNKGSGIKNESNKMISDKPEERIFEKWILQIWVEMIVIPKRYKNLVRSVFNNKL